MILVGQKWEKILKAWSQKQEPIAVPILDEKVETQKPKILSRKLEAEGPFSRLRSWNRKPKFYYMDFKSWLKVLCHPHMSNKILRIKPLPESCIMTGVREGKKLGRVAF